MENQNQIKIILKLFSGNKQCFWQLNPTKDYFSYSFFSTWTMRLAGTNSLPIWCGHSERQIISYKRKNLAKKNQTKLVNHSSQSQLRLFFNNFVFQQMDNAIGQSKLFANSMRAQWRQNYCQKRLNFNKKIYQNLWTIVQKSQSQLG